jgi:hypothetical protein
MGGPLVGGHARHDFVDPRRLGRRRKSGRRYPYHKLHTCYYAPHQDCERTMPAKHAWQIDAPRLQRLEGIRPAGLAAHVKTLLL